MLGWLFGWLAFAPLLAAATPAANANAVTITSEGFAVPQPGRKLTFPRDHGSHPEFKVEWWYLTGHLEAADGRKFGFQATFFQNAGPTPNPAPTTNAFAAAPIYLGHMALLDVATGRFLHQARINRAGWDAGSAQETLRVWNGNWSLKLADPVTGRLELAGGVRAEAAFQLTLEPRKPLVVFGTNGVSRKGADPTAASHYLTFPRLAATGSLTLGTESLAVTGLVWMDHEISSSQLEAGQAGWDWACLQLDDGRDLMAYRMRRDDGSTDPFSTLAWVGKDGAVRHFGPDRFRWEPRGTWTSPLTGAKYPNRVRLVAPDPDGGADRELFLEPLADAQEITDPLGGVAYWEGACRVKDANGRVIGRAYLELTGYIGRLADRFR
jgi:predicted secreted hydrolase